MKTKGLGQGVGLLFNEEPERFFECPIANIIPNREQPRTVFNDAHLEELAASIEENGIIQPLIVTATDNDGIYELIAGERRLRASKLVGLTEVPVVLLDIENKDSHLELALIENIQRTDLNAIEEAEAYKRLIDKFSYTQEETAKKVGKQRSTVTNLLRLLKLPRTIQQDVSDGLLSEGHGRALVKLVENPSDLHEIRNDIIKNGLSVRATEKLIKKATHSKPMKERIANSKQDELPKSYANALTTQLTNKLNSRVVITHTGNRGKIEIEYYSIDDLDRVTALIVGE